jgi:hypothetical protein
MESEECFKLLKLGLESKFDRSYYNVFTANRNTFDYAKRFKTPTVYGLCYSDKSRKEEFNKITQKIDSYIDILRTQDLHVALLIINGFNFYPLIKGNHDRTISDFIKLLMILRCCDNINLDTKKEWYLDKLEYDGLCTEAQEYDSCPDISYVENYKWFLYNYIVTYGSKLIKMDSKGMCLNISKKDPCINNVPKLNFELVITRIKIILSNISNYNTSDMIDFFFNSNTKLETKNLLGDKKKLRFNYLLPILDNIKNHGRSLFNVVTEDKITSDSSDEFEMFFDVDEFKDGETKKKPDVKVTEKDITDDISMDTSTDNSTENVKEKPKRVSESIKKKVKDEVWRIYCGNTTTGKCFCCNSALNKDSVTWHGGHVLAASNYGEYTVNNIRPVCADCNSNKNGRGMGTTHMYEYMVTRKMDGMDNLDDHQRIPWLYGQERKEKFRECDIKLNELLKLKVITESLRSELYKIIISSDHTKDRTFYKTVNYIKSLKD